MDSGMLSGVGAPGASPQVRTDLRCYHRLQSIHTRCRPERGREAATSRSLRGAAERRDESETLRWFMYLMNIDVLILNSSSSSKDQSCSVKCGYNQQEKETTLDRRPTLQSSMHLHPLKRQTSNFCTPLLPPHSHLREVRRIQKQPHKHTTNRARNRDRHNPRRQQQANTLPVDRLVSAIAQTDTHSGAGNAHRRRDGEGELAENEHGDGGAHLHAAAARGGVVGDFVAHDCES